MTLSTTKLLFTQLSTISLLVSGLLLSGCDRKQPPPAEVVRPVKSMVILDHDAKILRSFPGKVLPNQESAVAFQVPGKINKITVLKGQSITQGQMLASLDPSTYQDTVDRAKAKYREALAQFNRGSQLVKNNYISRSDYDKLRSKMEIAKANLSTAETNLGYTQVHAPFDGVVARRYVEQFDQVQAKQKILDVHDISNVDVEVNIPENIVLYLRDLDRKREVTEEDVPRVYFESMPGRSYPLKLKEFTTEADEDTQTYAVRLTLPQPKDMTILPGMSVIVKAHIPDVSAGKVGEFTVIPSSAVFANAKKEPSVWLIDPNTLRVHTKVIRVSKLTGDSIRVLEGLKHGDRIVTAGVHFLLEDQKVQLMQDTLPKADQPKSDQVSDMTDGSDPTTRSMTKDKSTP